MIHTTQDKDAGRKYAGPTLPDGATLVGTVTRGETDTGALVELNNGQLVQYNAGVIRRLPGDLGRPRLCREETKMIGVVLPLTLADRIPEPKSAWVRELITVIMECWDGGKRCVIDPGADARAE